MCLNCCTLRNSRRHHPVIRTGGTAGCHSLDSSPNGKAETSARNEWFLWSEQTVSNNKSRGKTVRENCMKTYCGVEVQLLNLLTVCSWVTNCTPSPINRRLGGPQGQRGEEHVAAAAAAGNRDSDRTAGN
jgi:hypothetical protein